MLKVQQLMSKKYSRLTITEIGPPKSGGRKCIAVCDCGITKSYNLSSVMRGDVKSCGCLQRENAKYSNTKHGLKQHTLYSIWCNMKTRCTNPKSENFKWYGGKGITICNDWLNDFKIFFEWSIANGWAEGMQLDRKDGSKPYYPDNCRFVTPSANSRNRTSNVVLIYQGESKCLTEWCELLNLDYSSIHHRIARGWDTTRALETPLNHSNA